MPVLKLILDIESAQDEWPELLRGDSIHLGMDAPPIYIAGLKNGMTSGTPSVMIRLDLPDGRTVLAETSLKLFLLVADALRVRYGDPRT